MKLYRDEPGWAERLVARLCPRSRCARRCRRNCRVLADYDQLWEELGARKRTDGDYELDCAALAAPDMDTIPSKKRAEARRKFEVLTQLADGVCKGLRAR